jgi:hypothetical protein
MRRSVIVLGGSILLMLSANCFLVDEREPETCEGVTCSGFGTCLLHGDFAVCECDEGYTPSSSNGFECVPTAEICRGGEVDFDFDDDGVIDDWFEPNEDECWMYELLNRTRATHDDEGHPECHKPLGYSVKWSARGRRHCHRMQAADDLYHDDYPMGQNIAYGCDPPCEMDLYMNGEDEPHCPDLSHHCNIMRCGYQFVGIGIVDTWNTQNFY